MMLTIVVLDVGLQVFFESSFNFVHIFLKQLRTMAAPQKVHSLVKDWPSDCHLLGWACFLLMDQ